MSTPLIFMSSPVFEARIWGLRGLAGKTGRGNLSGGWRACSDQLSDDIVWIANWIGHDVSPHLG